jgi:DNA-binding beta-propeller fold protein YncE
MKAKLFSIIFGFLCLPICICQGQYLAMVGNTESDSVTIFDPLSGRVTAKLPAGKHPQDIRVSKIRNVAYVLNMGSGKEPGNTISVYDLKTYALKSIISLGDYKRPHWSMMSSDEKLLWVACAPQQAIVEVDLEEEKVARVWNAKQPGPYNFTVSSDGNKIFTANFDTTTVSIIDRKKDKVEFLEIGGKPIGADTSPDGKEIWISSNTADKISIIDPKKGSLIKTISSESKDPVRLKFTNDGTKVLVVHISGGELCVFDARKKQLLWKLAISNEYPKSIAISKDDKYALIALAGGQDVITVDLEKKSVVSKTRTGSGPEGIVFIQ